jgi:hypothetical protein
MPKHHEPNRQKVTNEEFRKRVKEINEKNAMARGQATATLPFRDGVIAAPGSSPNHPSRRRAGRGELKAKMELARPGAKFGYRLDDPVFTDPKVTEFGRAHGDKRICYYCHYWDHPGACTLTEKDYCNGISTVEFKQWRDNCKWWRKLTKAEAKARGYDEA